MEKNYGKSYVLYFHWLWIAARLTTCMCILHGRPEPKFIREIVIEVLKKLFGLYPGDAKCLVEEDSPIQNTEVVPSPHSSTLHIAPGHFDYTEVDDIISQHYSQLVSEMLDSFYIWVWVRWWLKLQRVSNLC